jgi:hypothetical protein
MAAHHHGADEGVPGDIEGARLLLSKGSGNGEGEERNKAHEDESRQATVRRTSTGEGVEGEARRHVPSNLKGEQGKEKLYG